MRRINIFILCFFLVCVFSGSLLPKAHTDEVDLSDVPLATIPSSGPANIMFVIDDSGSMDHEFMTPGDNGVWNGNSDNVSLFQDPGDNNYPGRNDLHDMGAVMRWKSQWSKYNKMYYNPDVTYEPWPQTKEIADSSFDARSQDDASWPNTRSHPMHDDWKLDLTARFFYFEAGIIVDDEDSGYKRLGSNSTWYEESDGSKDSGKVIEGGYEEGTLLDSDGNRTSVTGARWTPNLPESREYDVYVNWPAESDNEVKVNYVVHHQGTNSTHGPFDHTTNSSGWKKLDTYDFDAGSSGYVELEIDDIYGNGTSLELAADAVKFVPSGTTSVDIPRAHYYVWSESEGAPYLVVLDPDEDEIEYYKATGSSIESSLANNDDVVEHLILDPDPPSDVRSSRKYSEAMDNFANWYSFYRRRELSSNAAVARVINDFSGVQVGIKSIHDRISQEVLPVHLNGTDQTQSLLEELYGIYASGGTPLRDALKEVGQYYDDTDSNNGGLGACPYVSQSEGGACQQSFSIVMTDGYWNGGSPSVGNADSTSNLSYSFQDSDGDYLYSDSYDNTLADVAMYYYERDLSSSLPNAVPQNPESVPTKHDPAEWQHMITYTVAFGQTGNFDPDDFTLDVNASSPDYPDWPDPTDNDDKERVDDLWHAAINGRGKFLSAENPNALVLSLQEILGNIEKRRGSSSSVSINGDELYQEIDSDIRLFQSSYNSATWTGDVQSYGINATTGDVKTTPEWSAAWQLNNNSTWSNRWFATHNGTDGVEFALGSLNSTQKTSLNNNSTLVDYLKGDQSHEGGPYRARSSLLGDIVHSSPSFHEDVIYAGGNDGMLHAFNATTGKELFAYVPGMVVDDLSALAQTDYSHQYYVDLTPVVKKAPHMLNPDDKEESLLVGGLRKGGKGYYALDVTNAGSISSSSDLADEVLWEYTNAAHLGYTYSRPSIVRSNDSDYEWIILFGNGYNSQQGHAELFILDTDGNLVKRLDTGFGYASGTEKNGLSTPTPVDVDNDQKVDYVYAGDLKGNMWKFDLSKSDHNKWKVAYHNSTSPQPLFRAKNENGNIQPITTKPDVMKHCREHGYMVLFGTGKHLAKSDNTDTTQQSVYGIWDYGDDSDDTEYLGTFSPNASKQLSNQPEQVGLLEQEVNATVNATGNELRITSDKAATWATENDSDSPMDDPTDDTSNHAGWYLDLPLTGENVVTPVMIRDGNLIFVSYDPDVSPCSLGGYSFVHEVDACDGDRLATPVFDIDGDKMIDQQDKVNYNGKDRVPSAKRYEGKLQPPAITRKSSGDEEVKYFSSSTGTIETMTEKAARIGVIFWKEMAN